MAAGRSRAAHPRRSGPRRLPPEGQSDEGRPRRGGRPGRRPDGGRGSSATVESARCGPRARGTGASSSLTPAAPPTPADPSLLSGARGPQGDVTPVPGEGAGGASTLARSHAEPFTLTLHTHAPPHAPPSRPPPAAPSALRPASPPPTLPLTRAHVEVRPRNTLGPAIVAAADLLLAGLCARRAGGLGPSAPSTLGRALGSAALSLGLGSGSPQARLGSSERAPVGHPPSVRPARGRPAGGSFYTRRGAPRGVNVAASPRPADPVRRGSPDDARARISTAGSLGRCRRGARASRRGLLLARDRRGGLRPNPYDPARGAHAEDLGPERALRGAVGLAIREGPRPPEARGPSPALTPPEGCARPL